MNKQLFQLQHPQQSHPLSLRRVLYVKLLRWVDKSSSGVILRTTAKLLFSVGLVSLVCAHAFVLGVLTSAAQWNGYKIPIAIALFTFVWNMKKIFATMKRLKIKNRTGNQHTYHGIPVGELAAFLQTQRSFKREEAMKNFALSQGQYHAIAKELKDNGVLYHGENNAHVLRDIGTAQLVTQLREGFPMVWSEERQCWAERNGAMERWALSHDFKTRQLAEDIEKKERKIERLEKKIETTKNSSVFAELFAHSA